MRHTKVKVAAGILLALLATSCKTTEKNYREAYDVAKLKEQRDAQQQEEYRRDLGLENSELAERADGLRRENIGGQQVWVRHIYFPRAQGVKRYSLCFATMKMKGNAESMAEDLKSEGWPDALTAHGQGNYFVIAGTCDDPAEAAAAYRKVKDAEASSGQRIYPGQPDAIILTGN